MGSSHDKGKRFEKKTGKLLLEHDGECPKWGDLTTETARTGQLSDLQVDVLTRSCAVECKNGKNVSKRVFDWFEQIAEQADKHSKEPVLCLKKDGRKYRRQNELHCITPSRHAELLRKEREYDKDKT